jgi:hypothetical protein
MPNLTCNKCRGIFFWMDDTRELCNNCEWDKQIKERS